MKVVMKASEIGSAFTHLPGHQAKAVFKTLDKGQYAIKAKDVVMENAKTGEVVELGNATPLSSKVLFQYGMEMPKHMLAATLPGIVGAHFAEIGTWKDKDMWLVKFKVKES